MKQETPMTPERVLLRLEERGSKLRNLLFKSKSKPPSKAHEAIDAYHAYELYRWHIHAEVKGYNAK